MSGSIWKRRHTRVGSLQEDHPYAGEILEFYDRVLDVQEPIYIKSKASSIFDSIRSSSNSTKHYLELDQFSVESCLDSFDKFLVDMQPILTEILAPVGSRMMSSSSSKEEVLAAFLKGQSLDPIADELGHDPVQLEFFPRAFLQPIVEALVEKIVWDITPSGNSVVGDIDGHSALCPYCGRKPVVGILEDEPEKKGGQKLYCSLCAGSWIFPRLTCSACGEGKADELEYHVSEIWPHVRVDECKSCLTYIKVVDMRTNGHAVPVVDEIASVDLDLWARDQGLAKYESNLLGL